MAKRCPPGVICFENMTIFIILICIGLLVYFTQYRNLSSSNIREKIIIKENQPSTTSLFNMPGQVLLNPLVPPLRTNPSLDIRGAVPINVATQGGNYHYRQVGILTRLNGPEMILSLMGKPVIANRDKWEYYCISDQYNSIKLPLTSNGRSCTGEYGCDSLSNGDTVYVEGYDSAFKVTLYDMGTPRYIPVL